MCESEEMNVETNDENEFFSPSLVSTRSNEFISGEDIEEITDFVDSQSLSTSAVLSTCKRKILKPYLRLLAITGFRSFGSDQPNASVASTFFSRIHLFQTVLFAILGYALQYTSCFRRDRGFFCRSTDNISFNVILFSVIVPCCLHFTAYIYVLYLFRYKETEILENLMERTFLLRAHGADGQKTSNLVIILWVLIFLSILWVGTSFCVAVFLFFNLGDKAFEWIHSFFYKIVFEIFLMLAVLWHDTIQGIIIMNYCLQAWLLSASLNSLREKLLQHTICPLSWVREINECFHFLNYLNRHFSHPVSIFIFLNFSWIISTTIQILRDNDSSNESLLLVSFGVWVIPILAPLLMAAKLSSSCVAIRHLGHEVRSRPFVYQDTPGEDLDTILLYTSTLKMKAKLFTLSVSEGQLYILFTLCGLSIIIMGQASFI